MLPNLQMVKTYDVGMLWATLGVIRLNYANNVKRGIEGTLRRLSSLGNANLTLCNTIFDCRRQYPGYCTTFCALFGDPWDTGHTTTLTGRVRDMDRTVCLTQSASLSNDGHENTCLPSSKLEMAILGRVQQKFSLISSARAHATSARSPIDRHVT
jgi:hypothetical protein